MATQFRDRRITMRHAMVMAGIFGGETYSPAGDPRVQYDGRGPKHNRLPELRELADWGYVALHDHWELTAAGYEEFRAPRVEELATAVAANYLNVSTKHLRGLLEAGEIPIRQVGQRYLVRKDDLEAYKAKDDAERAKVADELTRLGQEMEQ